MAIFGRLGKSKKATASRPPILDKSYHQTCCASHNPSDQACSAHHNSTAFETEYVTYYQGPSQRAVPLPYHPYQQMVVPAYHSSSPQMHSGINAVFGQNIMSSCSVAALPALLVHIGDVPEYVADARFLGHEPPEPHGQCMCGRQCPSQNCEMYALISSKFNAVATGIDIDDPPKVDNQKQWIFSSPVPEQHEEKSATRGQLTTKGQLEGSKGFLAKVDLYANSKLPLELPRIKLYIPTFPLLCLAARYSDGVYEKPLGHEREAHIEADWRTGTKAMVVKSVPMDDKNIIVFAIRGTRVQNFFDWMVNLDTEPSSPAGFLDDSGNYCHAGFLSVARKMIKPVAARLRHLLEEDPRRCQSSLLITGHSAGGAIAALLYSHMLAVSKEAKSELNILTDCFKRIHCVTFGAPPVSLLPLKKSDVPHLEKSIFLSFINEGDPIARAEKAYLRSLIDLYSKPAPGSSRSQDARGLKPRLASKSSSVLNLNHQDRPSAPQHSSSVPTTPKPVWTVPTATLSNAGRLVLLRSVPGRVSPSDGRKQGKRKVRMNDGVQARIVTDEQLRSVIWGHLHAHEMKLYARRIEVLATNAVIGQF